MSDVPATAWALASVYSALRARRSGAWWAAAAGAAFGIAVLVRPTNVLMALPLALALPWSAGVLGAFLAGGAPFAAALAAYDVHCYGSPFQSGYGKGGLFTALALRYFGPRMRHYGGWILRTLTPLVPAAWLALLALRRTPARTRALLLLWFGSFFLFYCLYEPYDSFFFVRFLLPGAPGLFLGALLAAREAAATVRGLGRLFALTAAGAGAIVLAAELRSLRETGVLDLARGESTYPAICRWAEIALPRNSVVVSMAASGALEYYTGLAYANWAWLSPESFSDIVRRTRARGVRWFALLFPFEAEEPDRLDAHAPGPWRRIGTLRGVGLYELAP